MYVPTRHCTALNLVANLAECNIFIQNHNLFDSVTINNNYNYECIFIVVTFFFLCRLDSKTGAYNVFAFLVNFKTNL